MPTEIKDYYPELKSDMFDCVGRAKEIIKSIFGEYPVYVRQSTHGSFDNPKAFYQFFMEEPDEYYQNYIAEMGAGGFALDLRSIQ